MKSNVSFNSTLTKFGIGLFETIKVTDYPLDLDLHMNRLFNSIKELNLSIENDKEFYKETILNDLLFSDEISIDDYFINYTVDDMGSYYYIVTTIKQNDSSYSFNLEINIETLVISSFDYQ